LERRLRAPRDRDVLLIIGTAVVAVVAVVFELPAAIRIPLGLVAALLVPGYAISLVLFSEAELDGIERLALALALSLGVIVVLAPIINLSPAGLTPDGLMVAITAVTLTAAALAWAQSPAEGGTIVSGPGSALRSMWTGATRWALGTFAVAAIVLAVGYGTRPPAAAGAAEFYLVAPGGFLNDIPSTVEVGRPVIVVAGITNLDDATEPYRIVVETGAVRLATAGPIELGPQGVWQGSVGFSLHSPGAGQEIRFLLYRGSGAAPIRSLRLVIDAIEPSPVPSPAPT
jgi:uncharacterized membrane protein